MNRTLKTIGLVALLLAPSGTEAMHRGVPECDSLEKNLTKTNFMYVGPIEDKKGHLIRVYPLPPNEFYKKRRCEVHQKVKEVVVSKDGLSTTVKFDVPEYYLIEGN